MKKYRLVLISICSLCAALAMPLVSSAQSTATQKETTQHHHYKFIDLGTLGGPKSGVNGEPGQHVINNSGTVVGGADTSTPEPSCFNPVNLPDCFVSHAFVWNGESLKDLGTLPGGNFSFAAAINQLGQIAGVSENSLTDPASGNSEFHAVLWENGKILDLGTLGGTASFAATLNDRGQVTGVALNDVPDPFSILGSGDGTTLTQTRGFIWQNGKMQDLGTLGGPDSFAVFVNDRGQVAGVSYTSDIPDSNTGFLQLDPFVWENGRMKDLGNLGGTNGFLGPFVNGFNNLGQVAGTMALSGEQFFHAFLWDGEKLSDLGTFGGNFSFATGINDAGEVVGAAYFSGDLVKHAFLQRNGVMTDLGTVDGDPCSSANNVNSKGQVVGASQSAAGGCGLFTSAFLWENGGPSVDLNALVPLGTPMQLNNAAWINDRGEITGEANPPGSPNDDSRILHAYVLIPCDENHPDIAGCDYSLVDAAAVQSSAVPIPTANAAATQASLTPSEMKERLRAQFTKRNRRFGVPAPK